MSRLSGDSLLWSIMRKVLTVLYSLRTPPWPSMTSSMTGKAAATAKNITANWRPDS